ncbi:MAG TPA: HD domain-containing protein [Saprospiraceae bacterium]|nr:HD domain-containing protein [Saprospiraceae bacterium]
MDTPNIIEKIKNIVKQKLENAEAGHDWLHIERVYNMAVRISTTEQNVDMQVVEYASLLHDIADAKFYNGDEKIGPKMAREILEQSGVPEYQIIHTVKIIENMSFKGGHAFSDFGSKELDIVRDADRLDAIGAIGIARAFTYGGFKGRKLYDFDIHPDLKMSRDAYKNNNGPTINHFYEKLLLLKDKMNTKEGRRLAESRHAYMEEFLKQFLSEVKR